MSDLTFQIANNYLTKFSADFDIVDSVMAQHADAMRCCDCEDHLAMGIRALEWIGKVEALLNEAETCSDSIRLDPSSHREMVRLYATWLLTAEKAEEEVAALSQIGHYPDNLAAFRAACDIADEAVQRYTLEKLANNAKSQLFDQEEW